jgi:hypothetical protein
MMKITVADTVKEKTPQVIKDLPDVDYRLTKIHAKSEFTRVSPGEGVSGSLEVVDVQGDPALRVTRGLSRYIRTSPIVKVLDQTQNGLTVETEGGIYKLEKLNVEN